MPVDVGTIAPVAWVRGSTHADATVSLTVTGPGGVTTSPSVTESATTAGTYEADVDTTTLAGRYLLRWSEADDEDWTDILDVWPADPRFIISLDDAANALQWRDADKRKNGETLRLYVAAATEVLEDITGAILIRTVEAVADGGRPAVLLHEKPTEIVSVTAGGTTLTGWVPNLVAGILYAGSTGEHFPSGRQVLTITYRTGAATIPPSIRLAARELIRHMWQVGQQVRGPDPTDPETMSLTPMGYLVPNRVIQLCANRPRLPGMA